MRGGDLAVARCQAVYIARLVCGASARHVALRLGRDDSSFVRPLAELEHRLARDPALHAHIIRLVESLNPLSHPPTPNQQNQD